MAVTTYAVTLTCVGLGWQMPSEDLRGVSGYMEEGFDGWPSCGVFWLFWPKITPVRFAEIFTVILMHPQTPKCSHVLPPTPWNRLQRGTFLQMYYNLEAPWSQYCRGGVNVFGVLEDTCNYWLALPVGNEGPSTFTGWYIGDETSLIPY